MTLITVEDQSEFFVVYFSCCQDEFFPTHITKPNMLHGK